MKDSDASSLMPWTVLINCCHSFTEYRDTCANVEKLCEENKYIPPPVQVCGACFTDHSSASWLAKLCCVHPENHSTKPKTTVICAARNRKLVKVRPPPKGSEIRKHLLKPGERCQAGEGCASAHSNEEYSYWTREHITNLYKRMVSAYKYLSPQCTFSPCTVIYACIYVYWYWPMYRPYVSLL